MTFLLRAQKTRPPASASPAVYISPFWQILFYAAIVALLCLVVYGKVWEGKQPIRNIVHSKIQVIEERHLKNDLNWTTKRYRVHIAGESNPIVFPADRWDIAVKTGDTVDLAVRQSFQWFGLKKELDGLAITKAPMDSLTITGAQTDGLTITNVEND